MPSCCAGSCAVTDNPIDPRFRKALWIALVVNTLMFGVEIVGGVYAGSVSLLADAVDFAGDAANYAISLAVLSMGLLWRARAALIKGVSMAVFGALVIGKTLWASIYGATPGAFTMGAIGMLAMLANLGVALMLYRFRDGEANMRSVWLCSRNDAIVNFAIVLAAIGVFGSGTRWPDLIVAVVIAGLALSAGLSVIAQARREIAAARKAERARDTASAPRDAVKVTLPLGRSNR